MTDSINTSQTPLPSPLITLPLTPPPTHPISHPNHIRLHQAFSCFQNDGPGQYTKSVTVPYHQRYAEGSIFSLKTTSMSTRHRSVGGGGMTRHTLCAPSTHLTYTVNYKTSHPPSHTPSLTTSQPPFQSTLVPTLSPSL